MDYEQKAKTVADCLLSYKRDESGWKVCKKSVNIRCYYGLLGSYLVGFFYMHAVLRSIDRGTNVCFIITASLGRLCQLS